MTGRTITEVFARPSQVLICSTEIGVRVLPNRPTVWSVATDVEDELGLAAGDGAGDLPGLGVGDLEVEGQVFAGDLARGFGAADVEGVVVAELAVELGAAGEGLFEVEGVGDVEGGGDVGDAVVADLVEAGVDVAVVLGIAAAFFGGFGVEPDQGGLDEPVDLRPGAAVGVGGELAVDERGGVGG